MLDKYVYANIISFLPTTCATIDDVSSHILNKEEALSLGIFVDDMVNYSDLVKCITSRKKRLAIKIARKISARNSSSFHDNLVMNMLGLFPQAQIDYCSSDDFEQYIDNIHINRWVEFCPTYLQKMICSHPSIASIASENHQCCEIFTYPLNIFNQTFVNETFLAAKRDVILDYFQRPSRRKYLRHLSEYKKEEFRDVQKRKNSSSPIISPMGYTVRGSIENGYSRVNVSSLSENDRQMLLASIIIYHAMSTDIRYVIMEWSYELMINDVWHSHHFRPVSFIDRLRYENSLQAIQAGKEFVDLFVFDTQPHSNIAVSDLMIEVHRGHKTFIPNDYEKSVAYLAAKTVQYHTCDVDETFIGLQSILHKYT
jgi:hypothetical protein